MGWQGLNKTFKTSEHCLNQNRRQSPVGNTYVKCPSGYQITGAATWGNTRSGDHAMVSNSNGHKGEAECNFKGKWNWNICQAQCCK